jgi:glycosyltransferase involved in cell wall biosynthesis
MASELRRRIHSFDVVHIHSLYLFPTLTASAYARKFGVPYILRPHGTLDPYLRSRHWLRKAIYVHLIERRNWNKADAIHYTSSEEMLLAAPLKIRAPGCVIPLGVDLAEFQRLPKIGNFRARFGLENKPLVVFLGRITQKKGIDLLIQAFAVVTTLVPSAQLVLAGPEDPKYGMQVRRWLKQAGVQQKTTMTGMLVGREKLELLVDTDVWALPSYTENFGMAVVEAMACGVPVVITDRVNIHRDISEAGAGLVVGTDALALARALTKILLNRNLGSQLGEAGKELVASRFTWDRAAAELRNLYEAVASSTRNTAARVGVS